MLLRRWPIGLSGEGQQLEIGGGGVARHATTFPKGHDCRENRRKGPARMIRSGLGEHVGQIIKSWRWSRARRIGTASLSVPCADIGTAAVLSSETLITNTWSTRQCREFMVGGSRLILRAATLRLRSIMPDRVQQSKIGIIEMTCPNLHF